MVERTDLRQACQIALDSGTRRAILVLRMEYQICELWLRSIWAMLSWTKAASDEMDQDVI